MAAFATQEQHLQWLRWYRSRVSEVRLLPSYRERFERMSSVIEDVDRLIPFLGNDQPAAIDFHALLVELYLTAALYNQGDWPAYRRRLEREFHGSGLLDYAQRVGIQVVKIDLGQLNREAIREFLADSLEPYTFFLGAGASRAAPSSIPVVSELLEEVWRRAKLLENNPLVELENHCRVAGVTNIEDVMTALFVGSVSVRRTDLPGLLQTVLHTPSSQQYANAPVREPAAIEQFNQTFNTFFSVLAGTMLDAPPNEIHQTIAKLLEHNPGIRVLTTNYDACMESALEDAEHQQEDALIKIHGSITWFYCGDCQRFTKVSIGLLRQAIDAQIPYPLVGMCPSCKGQVLQFLVPPTSFKWIRFPPLIQLWEDASDAIRGAKLIITIGYSFGDSDDYVVRTLMKSLVDDSEKRLLIIDPSRVVSKRLDAFLQRHARTYPQGRVLFIQAAGEDMIKEIAAALPQKTVDPPSSTEAQSSAPPVVGRPPGT